MRAQRRSCRAASESEMILPRNRIPSLAELNRLLREKAIQFANFAFNRQTGEIFGKTYKGWGLTFGYLLLFYSILAAIFAVHMAVFYAATPEPGQDVLPVNFGRYAYPNYPNARIGLMSVPKSFSYDGDQTRLSSSKLRDIADLIDSANSSGVPELCLDEETNFGYNSQTPCIFFRVQKVLEWAPETLNESLSDSSILPLSCSVDTIPDLVVEMTTQPDGLPLDLPNHISPSGNRSYPFRGKDSSYITPVMAVMVNLTTVDRDSLTDHRFSIKITCGVNLTAIGLENHPADQSQLFELPKSASTTISVRL